MAPACLRTAVAKGSPSRQFQVELVGSCRQTPEFPFLSPVDCPRFPAPRNERFVHLAWRRREFVLLNELGDPGRPKNQRSGCRVCVVLIMSLLRPTDCDDGEDETPAEREKWFTPAMRGGAGRGTYEASDFDDAEWQGALSGRGRPGRIKEEGLAVRRRREPEPFFRGT
jgi:hypothetical protein